MCFPFPLLCPSLQYILAFPLPLIQTNGYIARSSVEKNRVYQSLAASHGDTILFGDLRSIVSYYQLPHSEKSMQKT